MESVNLIVYGTLMRGESNSPFCRNATFISPCDIEGTLYDTGWGFPAFVPDGQGVVKAEFVVLPVADLPPIDRLEGFRPCGHSMYQRVMVPAARDSIACAVWTYTMHAPQNSERITNDNQAVFWKSRH